MNSTTAGDGVRSARLISANTVSIEGATG